MAELIRAHADRDPGGRAVADEHEALTWQELDERVNRWIDVLRGSGLTPGDRVAFVVGNGRRTLEALLACLHTGLVVTPVNWHLTPAEVAHVVADSGSRGVLADPAYATTAAVAAPGCVVRLVMGNEAVAGLTPVEPLLAAASPAEPAAQCCGSLMFYTSGTTGRPHGVVTPLFDLGAPMSRLGAVLRVLAATLPLPRQGLNALVGPWYHSAQFFFAVFPLLAGCPLVVRARFDAAEFLALVDAEAVTHAHLVPIHFVRLLRTADTLPTAVRPASLRRVWHGGAPCPPDVKRRMLDWWGPVLVEYYGATEGGIVSLIGSAEWARRPGSVGRPLPAVEVLVVDPEGRPLPAGHDGRIFVRRRDGRDFRYHGAPEKTRDAHLAPGVFTYGDIGHLDEDGYLYVTGRSIDLIISGGVNVYPAEVEAVLLAHPAVRDAAVFGVPDGEYGEQVTAVVELDPGRLSASDAPEELDRYCRERLAGFKVPRSYDIVTALPRSAAGKVATRALRGGYGRASACGA